MTKEEKIIATAFTGKMFIDGSEMGSLYEYMEKKVGHGVIDLMLASKEFWEELHKACEQDFIDMVSKEQLSLPSNLDEAAEEATIKKFPNEIDLDGDMDTNIWYKQHVKYWRVGFKDGFKVGAEWMAGQGWHDVTETPSIFGFYLVIHEKGWCVANYLGKGTVCESGWVEAIHHIEIERPQKWLDLRDLIPKKQ